MLQRLQKLLSAAGLCSRRTAETWIETGRVTVNGVRAQVGDQADPNTDDIRVDGKPLPGRKEPMYLMLNKPRGYACTLSDPHAAHLVTELVKGCGRRVYPVGRLDVESQGLLLLTDDGDFAHAVLHPSHQVDKVYQVTVRGMGEDTVSRLTSITDLDGEPVRPAGVRVLRRNGGRALLEFTIHEGRKRQIRRLCAKAGLTVEKLLRVSEQGVTLGDLKEGAWRPLTAEEVRRLTGKKQRS